MKKHATNFLLLATVIALVYWILARDQSGEPSRWLMRVLEPARNFYDAKPLFAIGAFCAVHILASLFSVPGSCTILNTLSGAVFGFWLGCAVVYPVTIVSACLMYFLASHLRDRPMLKGYSRQMALLQTHIQNRDYIFFVALRLSPLLPFGILNAIFGLARIPFGFYLMTTTVGIFFDVVLLNNLGAGLGAQTHSPQSEKWLALSFFFLFLVFFLLRLMLPKAYDQKSQPERS